MASPSLTSVPTSSFNQAASEHGVSQRRSGKSKIQLSWPRVHDGRRAIVGKASPPIRNTGPKTHRIIHVSHRDLEMHYYLARKRGKYCRAPTLAIPMDWNRQIVGVEHQQLLQYFQSTAASSLAVFGHNPSMLGDLLVRLALSTDTTSTTTAVRHGLLAYSSLHLHHVNTQAYELKTSAIRALTTPSRGPMGKTEAIQRIAAGMLLLSFEVHQASCASGEWTWYLRGVKEVIRAAGLHDLRQDRDLSCLLDWVYYHDVLARFSLRYWHRAPSEEASDWCEGETSPLSLSSDSHCSRAEVSSAPPAAIVAIQLLSEVCDATSAKGDADRKDLLQILDWKLRTKQPVPEADDDADARLVMELYQLATLVYLNRASQNLLNQDARAQQQIARAFSILATLRACDRQFPIFIFGCEAQSDAQRAIILDLVSRTEKRSSSRSFNYASRILQAIWVQDDLADRPASYRDRLSVLISRCRVLPTFV